jgi:hypothetical protein
MEHSNPELTPEKLEKIQLFQAVTEMQDDQKAIQYLQSHNWDVEQAINTALIGEQNPTPAQVENRNANTANGEISPELLNEIRNQDEQRPQNHQPQFQETMNPWGTNDDLYRDFQQAMPVQLPPKPQFTSEESAYFNAKEDRPGGFGNAISKVGETMGKIFSFKKSSGAEFTDAVTKAKTRGKEICINFVPTTYRAAREALNNQRHKPLLVFVLDPKHQFFKAMVNNIICDQQLGKFIDENFESFGVLTSSKEKDDWNQKNIPQVDLPCIMVLRNNLHEETIVFEQNVFNFKNENTITAQILRPPLGKAVEDYARQRNADQQFVINCERKRQARQDWEARKDAAMGGQGLTGLFNDDRAMYHGQQGVQQGGWGGGFDAGFGGVQHHQQPHRHAQPQVNRPPMGNQD